MQETIRHFSYHVFLLPVFFILHAINESYGLIPAFVAGRFLIYYLALSALLLLAGKLIFKSIEKGGIWAFSLLMVFYFFGAVHDFLKDLRIPSFLTSYSFILPTLLVLLIILTLLIKKRKRKFTRLVFFLNLLFGIFVLAELAFLFDSIITNKEKKLSLSGSDKPVPFELNQIDEHLKPDIFYIVFDEYASSESLKKYLNFDNKSLDSDLLHNGFYTASHSKSNYNVTQLSVGATFNMNYFNKPLEGKAHNADILIRGCKEVKLSEVPKMLERVGYKIKNFGLFDLYPQPVLTSNFFASYSEKIIYLQTLWGRIRRDIWWNVAVRLNKNAEKESIKKHVERNIINFKATTEELKIQNDTPKFVYTHIMMPHSPFFFNKDGSSLKNPLYNSVIQERDSLYLNQLIYTNSWIKELIENINSDHKRPRVMIIQGDHGFRGDLEIFPRERQFMNLNTFYFDDKDYNLLYDSISSVNTFRVIFKKYFHTDLPLLKDSTILLK